MVIVENISSGLARLGGRFARAARNGPDALAAEAHTMLAYRLHVWVLDRWFGAPEPAEVGARAELSDLTIEAPNAAHGVEYTPTPKLIVQWILSLLDGEQEKYHFVDFGSGAGRAVAIAARCPFKSATGIEFASELHAEAERYIGRLGPGEIRATSVNLIHGDATTAALPEGPCAMFLFNPFGKPVLKSLSERILAEFHGKPEKSIILYYNPVHRDVFDADARYEKLEFPRLLGFKINWLGPHRFAAYRVR